MAMAINKRIFFMINNYSVSYSRGLLNNPGDLPLAIKPWRFTASDLPLAIHFMRAFITQFNYTTDACLYLQV